MLTDALGLRRPVPASLDRRYAVALISGCGIAVVLGLQTAGRIGGDAWTIVSLLLWQPLIEELLFRGVVQGYLRRYASCRRSAGGLSIANVLASFGFVAVHLVNQPAPWALAVWFPSLLFGYFRDRTGSVWPSILLHCSFNAAFFLA